MAVTAKVKTFTKRTGTTDKGKDYEDRIIALFAFVLANDDRTDEFKITSKSKDHQGFDSLVLETNNSSYAIKLKYTQSDERQIIADNFVAPKRDFSLKKNFEYFQKSKNNKNRTFVLYTTRNLVVDFRQLMDLPDVAPYKVRMVPQIACPGHVQLIARIDANLDSIYRFEIVEDQIEEATAEQKSKAEDYKEFFEQFYLFTNQRGLEDVEEKCSTPFKTKYQCGQQAFVSYLDYITRWNMRDGRKTVLDKNTVRLKIAECLLNPHIQSLNAQDQCFNSQILEDAILSTAHDLTLVDKSVNDSILRIWSRMDDDCQDILSKINQANRCYEIVPKYISSFRDITPKEKNKLLWYLNQAPLVLKLDDSNTKTVLAALQLCRHKKLVLVVDDNFWQDECPKIPGNYFYYLHDLSTFPGVYQELLENFQVQLQGRPIVNLKQFIAEENDLKTVITTTELLGMVKGPLQIGGNLDPILVPLYVDRFLSKFIIRSGFFRKYTQFTDLCLVAHSSKANLSRDYALTRPVEGYLRNERFGSTKKCIFTKSDECSYEIFEQVCARNPGKVCHFLDAKDNDNFEWLASNGDISQMIPYRNNSEYFVHETSIFDYFKADLVIVCDDPGMGKSVLMTHIKNHYPKLRWVVKLQLRTQSAFFHSKRSAKDLLDFVANENQSSFDASVMRIFEKNIKIVFLWDGLDEIHSYCVNNVLDVMEQLRAMGFVQWITARAHLKNTLEDKFQVLSTKLRPFDLDQQKAYIHKRLADKNLPRSSLDSIVEKITSNIRVVKDNGFLGVPFQLSMITELFYHNQDMYNTLLDNTLSMTDVYHHFIEEKFHFYYHKAGCDFDNYLMLSIAEENKQFLYPRYQEVAASTCLAKSSSSEKFSEVTSELQQEGDPLGFITQINDQLAIFIHKTFGEYFAALHLTARQSELSVTLFESSLVNVRFFYDMLTAKHCQAHLAILYRNLDHLLRNKDLIPLKDQGGRSPLHLCCGWGETHWHADEMHRGSNTYSISESSLTRVQEETPSFVRTCELLLDMCDYLEPDELFGWDAVMYADQSRSLSVIEIMLDKGHIIDLTKLKSFSTCTFLYYAVRFNYTHIFSLLSNNLPYIHVHAIYEGNLLLMALDYGRTSFVPEFLKVRQYQQTLNYEGEDTFEMPCHLTCRRGDLEALKLLTRFGANLEAVLSYNKQTPLHVAAGEGHLHMVEFLLQNKVKVDPEDHSLYTPSHHAAANGHLSVVQTLLDHGASWNYDIRNIRRITYKTPLALAAENGHIAVVETMAEGRSRLDYLLALRCASSNSHSDVVRLLIIKLCERYGGDRLALSAQYGDVETVDNLVKKVDDPKTLEDLLVLGARNNKPQIVELLVKRVTDGARVGRLLEIATNGDGNLAKTLISSGILVNSTDSKGSTMLHYAYKPELVAYLITNGANVNSVNSNGDSPLHIATRHQRLEIVRLLLDAGAVVDLVNHTGDSPITLAARNLHLEMVQILIASGGSVHLPTAKTPLHEALYSAENLKELMDSVEISNSCSHHSALLHLGDPHLMDDFNHSQAWKEILYLVRYLIENNIDVDLEDSDGVRPLHIACSNGHLTVVKLLVDSEASVNATTKTGRTPLHCIVSKRRLNKKVVGYLNENDAILPENCLEIFNMLLEKGVDVNAQDEDGHTPLHLAAVAGDLEEVEILIRRGADVNIRNKYGWRPLEMSAIDEDQRDYDVEKYLAEMAGETYVMPKLEVVPYVRCLWRLKFLGLDDYF